MIVYYFQYLNTDEGWIDSWHRSRRDAEKQRAAVKRQDAAQAKEAFEDADTEYVKHWKRLLSNSFYKIEKINVPTTKKAMVHFLNVHAIRDA